MVIPEMEKILDEMESMLNELTDEEFRALLKHIQNEVHPNSPAVTFKRTDLSLIKP
jgi:hypothetical protein